MRRKTNIAVLLAPLLLAGCTDTLNRLEAVGKAPPMSEVKDPTRDPNYKPLSWPLPEAKTPPSTVYANSLWQPGARAFFRDQRAARVGDILRVKVSIQDKAEVDNQTNRNRTTTEDLQTPSVFGLEGRIFGSLPRKADPKNLVDTSGTTSSRGLGEIKREEKIDTMVAAMITQVLPNGNFVVQGKQEIRVNQEIREVGIQGVVRPQDINSDNTVDSTQVAEARIVYGGRGTLSDMQQPRWGNQLIEVLSPF